MVSTLLTKLVLLATVIDIVYSVAIYEQCAGEGYGNFPCDNGMACFRRNKWFSSCQYSCPLNLGWECEAYITLAPAYAAGWAQCAGEGWGNAKACPAGYACYARSIYYSQCRPIGDCPADWGCYAFIHSTTPIPRPVTLPAYTKCNDVANAVCPTGTACFRNNALYAECRPACPPTWACETDVAQDKEQCGGAGYVGLTRCAEGLRCYVRNQLYAQCAPSCPGADFIC